MEGFATLDKKLDFFCDWLADDWKWPEYAVPIYPRNEEETSLIRIKLYLLLSWTPSF